LDCNRQTLFSAQDTDAASIDSVRLGAIGVETGKRGVVFFDDYYSRRFSKIGPLPDPGIHENGLSLIEDWVNKIYEYDDADHKHAVTTVAVVHSGTVQRFSAAL
jgi:hypothetical protein